MQAVTLALLVVAAGLTVRFLARALRDYLKFRSLEMSMPGPPSLPVIGNGLSFLGVSNDTILQTLLKLQGGRTEMSRMSFLKTLVVFLSDPDDIGKFLKRKDVMDKAHFFYRFLQNSSPNGLIQLNGAKWKNHRKGISPAFHPDVIDSYQTVFAEEAEILVKTVKPGVQDFLFASLHRLTARAFVRTTMTSTIGDKEEHKLNAVLNPNTYLRTIMHRIYKPWMWPNYIFSKTSAGREFRKRKETLLSFADDVIRENKSKGGTSLANFVALRKTLIDILVEGRYSDLNPLSDVEIKDEIRTFLSAAVETNTAAICFALKMLSILPDVQRKVCDELDQVFGGSLRPVSLDDLSRLVYTEQFVKETLRMFPSVPFIARQINQATNICGKEMPEGAIVVINIFGVHRDPRHWPDPDRFDPDRFSPERSQGRHPHAWIPFSSGPRNCIGIRYAMMVVKTAVATVVRHFRVDPVPDGVTDPSQLKLSFNITLGISDGAKVVLVPKNAENQAQET